eukprot:TRINITY_DN26063_c0_g1_i1.p1 TRINITY_DN26063_c0_g1~~TRINITY_DN26063_c0_g1_i1.p1  ORF type:complete len:906 (-),score=179.79 TRINITY_DN26063_c0_g1_i1:42-2378(-)
MHVKAADKDIKDYLKKAGSLLFNGTLVHSYPHCWRSDTPLIYKAVPSWFVKVEDIRERLLANNAKTYWVPAFVSERRFHNWLSEARDWCVSRNRYWGTPLPLWASADFEEILCIGSIAELEAYVGHEIPDIHRHLIDHIEIPSRSGKGMLRRVDEVFDCWFESGAMPYAARHYPFKDKESFDATFPAQFIAEGLDQTRGWFYTLMVLSTHLFDKPPFQNLIVNGLVLAADGKKMSKRLRNFPDPQEIFEKHGADAVRMYLCNSPVVRAEPLKFKESGVRDVVKDVLLPWYNAYRFLVQEVFRYEGSGLTFSPDSGAVKASQNYMDQWINARSHSLVKLVREEMEAYRLYNVVPHLVSFLEDLTNWYVRFNRDRMRGANGLEDALIALRTLYDVLLNSTVLLAPICPFITELMYQNIARALPQTHAMNARSVHFVMIPEADSGALSPEVSLAVERLQTVIELGRTCRERKKIGSKMPVRSMTLVNKDSNFRRDLEMLEAYVRKELGVEQVIYQIDIDNVTRIGVLNFKAVGKRLGKDMKAVQAAVRALTQEQLREFEVTREMTVCGHTLCDSDLKITQKVEGSDDPNLVTCGDGETLVTLDFTPEARLARKALAHEVVSRVQQLRKETGLQQDDPVDIWAEVVSPSGGSGLLQQALEENRGYIDELLRTPLWSMGLLQGHETLLERRELELDEGTLAVGITRRIAFFNEEALCELVGGDAQAAQRCRRQVAELDLEALLEICAGTGSIEVQDGSKRFKLENAKHFVIGPGQATWLRGRR